MSSGQRTKDCLVGTNSQRIGLSDKMDIVSFSVDSSAKERVLSHVRMSVGGNGGGHANVESPDILTMDGGKLRVASPDEFKESFVTSECLADFRERLTTVASIAQSIDDLAEQKKANLVEEYDSVTAGYVPTGWPQKLKTEALAGGAGKSAADEDAYNKELSKYYKRQCTNIENERDSKLMQLKQDYPNMPWHADDACAMCYRKSAQATIRALESLLTADSFKVLTDRANYANISYRSDPPAKVLSSFVETINSFDVERSVAWFEGMTDQHSRLLNDGKQRNAQEHAQHFKAWTIEVQKVFGEKERENPVIVLARELRTIPQGSAFAAMTNKYRAMPADMVTLQTPLDLWEEMRRSPSTMTWAREPTSLGLSSTDLSSSPANKTKQLSRPAARISRVDMGQVATDRDKLKVKCYQCGRLGHMARECVNDAICYNCGQAGHLACECPHPSSAPHSRPQTPARARGRKSHPSAFVAQANNGNSVGALKLATKAKVTWADQATKLSAQDDVMEMKTKPHGSNAPKQNGPKEQKLVGKVQTLMIAKNKALGENAQKKQMQEVKMDTAADVTVCELHQLSNVTEHKATVVSFNGTECTSKFKGVLHVEIADKLDPSKKFSIAFEAWACDGVGPMPLISWRNMSKAGAEMRLAQGHNSTLNLKKLGGPMLHIHHDGRVNVVSVKSGPDSEGWQVVRRSRRSAQPSRATQRYAPRRQFGASPKND